MTACEGELPFGSQIVWTATFTTLDGVLTSPSAGFFDVRKPDGTELAPEAWPGSANIANPSPGVFVYTMPAVADQSGVWRGRAVGTSLLLAATPDESVTVSRSVFA